MILPWYSHDICVSSANRDTAVDKNWQVALAYWSSCLCWPSLGQSGNRGCTECRLGFKSKKSGDIVGIWLRYSGDIWLERQVPFIRREAAMLTILPLYCLRFVPNFPHFLYLFVLFLVSFGSSPRSPVERPLPLPPAPPPGPVALAKCWPLWRPELGLRWRVAVPKLLLRIHPIMAANVFAWGRMCWGWGSKIRGTVDQSEGCVHTTWHCLTFLCEHVHLYNLRSGSSRGRRLYIFLSAGTAPWWYLHFGLCLGSIAIQRTWIEQQTFAFFLSRLSRFISPSSLPYHLGPRPMLISSRWWSQ